MFDIASSGVIFSRHLDAVVDLIRLVLGRHQENSWWAGLVFGDHSWHWVEIYGGCRPGLRSPHRPVWLMT